MTASSTPLLRSHSRHRLPAALLALTVTVGIMTGCADASPGSPIEASTSTESSAPSKPSPQASGENMTATDDVILIDAGVPRRSHQQPVLDRAP